MDQGLAYAERLRVLSVILRESNHRVGCEEEVDFSALLAGAEALERQQWQPIETAPKDGTPVLLWAPGWELVHCGWWQHSINKATDAGWTDGTVASWGYEENTVLNPTKWMPMPTAPKEDE